MSGMKMEERSEPNEPYNLPKVDTIDSPCMCVFYAIYTIR